VAWSGQLRIGDGPPAPATIDLQDEALSLVPQGGDPVRLPLVDIDDLHDQDYVLRLTDHLGTRYELTMLGRAYGQVLADVSKARDAALERDLLLRGVHLQDTFPGKLFGGDQPVPVHIRLYEDLLVVVPERGTMFGVPFSSIEGVDWDEELYQVRVRTDEGSTLVFGHLAKRSEEFGDELGRLLEALARRTATTLAGLLPGLEPPALSRLAGRMRDGRAVQQWEVDAVDPSLWPRLQEAALGTDDLRAAYDRLKAMTVPGWAAFGVKAVLTDKPDEPTRMAWQRAGDATDRQSRADWGAARVQAYRDPTAMAARRSQEGSHGRREDVASAGGGTLEPAWRAGGGQGAETAGGTGAPSAGAESHHAKTTDLWYFCPLSVDGRPVNAVAQEVASESGHATYLFRLTDPDRWSSLSGEAQAGEVARGIARLNRALLQLNFRREPIYLPEDQIDAGSYGKYRVALRKLPHLRWARDAFLGRAIHNPAWESQVREAIGRA
jgi:hypothetical protein